MINQKNDVLRMLQEASKCDFGGDDPSPFLDGYMTALTVQPGYEFSSMIETAHMLVEDDKTSDIAQEVKTTIRRMMAYQRQVPTEATNARRKALEAQVMDDYRAVAGKVLEVTGGITGYVDLFVDDEQINIDRGGVPLIVRVMPTDVGSLIRWMDSTVLCDRIYPCWNIELLNHPKDLPKGFRASCMMFGTSYHLDGKVKLFKGKILPPGLHVRCPQDASHRTFRVVAKVTEDWRVDENAHLISQIKVVDTTHIPDTNDEWHCETCGETADVIDVKA